MSSIGLGALWLAFFMITDTNSRSQTKRSLAITRGHNLPELNSAITKGFPLSMIWWSTHKQGNTVLTSFEAELEEAAERGSGAADYPGSVGTVFCRTHGYLQ